VKGGHTARRGSYQRGGKRAFDFVAAGAALIVTLPVQGVVALLVRRRLGSPVLFRQERPGLGDRPFVILKFRTMTDEKDVHGRLLPDDVRLTRFGSLLRSGSLDELPELWNVMKGDMSLVGPRPLLMKYLPLYTSEQARRHDVRPGVTGWAQVNGRNAADWHDKLAMDTWYVDHVSFWLDLRILIKTVTAVFTREGISAKGHATAPEFTGRDPRPAS
jgi:sugar transferase EpsL